MYKVYKIEPRRYYHGMALVAAESVEEANEFINSFIKKDVRNYGDSWRYCHVSEYDIIEDIFSKNKGIVFCEIYYYGS